ncbi:MAG: phosphoribosylglycinamide formyltransferase [Deltaproteobacteria bacterium]|nr:phosphoribosylglycinamide formyltransferase [Deltaproteobacteria bacterium]
MSLKSPNLRFAIFASGRGSNALALMDAFKSGFIPAELALIVANIADAPIIQKAQERGYKVAVITHKGLAREQHEQLVLAKLTEANIDYILLAGYMRILSPHFLEQFKGTVINIHPSLLPDFPGLHGAERQWQAGRKVAGATVHQVGSGVDTGPILLQGSIEVRGDEGADGLAQRILHEVEHVIYPRAVRLFIDRLIEQKN